jgi:hypothetical protein
MYTCIELIKMQEIAIKENVVIKKCVTLGIVSSWVGLHILTCTVELWPRLRQNRIWAREWRTSAIARSICVVIIVIIMGTCNGKAIVKIRVRG